MSRGLGKVEKAVLRVFEDAPSELIDSVVLTFAVHGDEPTWSNYSSTRRALNRLREKGLIVRVIESGRFGRSFYALPEKAKAYHRKESERLKTLSVAPPV